MTGDMDVLKRLVDDGRARAEDAVDHAPDHILVTGDGRGGEDDGVAWLDLDLGVLVAAHARQARQRLALAARRQNCYLEGMVVADVLDPDSLVVVDMEIAQRARRIYVLTHAAPEDRHLAPVFGRDVEDRLDAVEIGA